MTRARELARLANENVLSVEDDSLEVGINSTKPSSTLDVAGQFNVGTAIKAGVAGVITATEFSGTTGTFSGNVSVGGTLTYEDVTNIDSVGIITARTGVRITAGGLVVTAGVTTITDDLKVNSTLTASEGINVSAGIATIASQLNIGSNIKAGTAGVVTATSFKGDGSGLTGVSAGLSTDVYFNTSGGIAALDSMTSGQALDNTAIGFNVLTACTTGDKNTGIGASALVASTTAVRNTAVGYFALKANTTGNSNTAVGSGALYANTTGTENIAIGLEAL